MRKNMVFNFFSVLIISILGLTAYADDSPSNTDQVLENLVKEESSTLMEVDSADTSSDDSFDDFDDFDVAGDLSDIEAHSVAIEDNWGSFNRAMFGFNDKVYTHVIKPGNKGYNYVVPEKARESVRKFFLNIGTPGRFLNCLFQGKAKKAGIEVARLLVNTTIGVAGLFDPASKLFHLEMQEEDFGQTLAKYGMDNGTYIVWPFIGPSSVRDSVGFVGDLAMNPLTFLSLFVTPWASLGRPYDTFNDFALDEGELYESAKEASIDPYIGIQEAYVQNRNKKIEE